MKIRMYSAFDRVMQVVQTPQPARTDAGALRAFERGILSEDGVREEDFVLLYVGEFDDSTGVFDGLAEPEVVVPNVEEVEGAE